MAQLLLEPADQLETPVVSASYLDLDGMFPCPTTVQAATMIALLAASPLDAGHTLTAVTPQVDSSYNVVWS